MSFQSLTMPVEIVPSETAENPNPRTAWEGCSVLLDINDGDRLVFARLTPSTTVKIGDKKLSLGPLVGCPFGSLFRVETGPKGAFLARVVSTPKADDAKGEEFCVKDEVRDNRALVDNNKAQGLSGEDIDEMRREGATGDDIVEALIANSSTFENKTSFSQEKYRLRKQKKYAPKVLLRRPFARSICEAYFKKYPDRIGFLRVDTLSLLLSLANVSAYSDVLVVDMVGGMVTGAVAERLGGTGYVCNTHFGEKPYSTAIVRIFNFSSEVCCRIVQSSFDDLSAECNNFEEPILHNAISSDTCSIAIEVTKCTETDSARSLTHSLEENIVEGDPCHLNGQLDTNRNVMIDCPSSSSNCTHETNVSPSKNVCRSANPGRQASLEAIKSWKQNGFTSMIVAAPELDVESIIQDLLPLLSYSSPFAIYHQYLQPLANCMHKLQAGKLAINLQILEPWTREYQVLPSRTHPHMQMSAFGGYILSGIRTCSSVDCAQGN